MTQKQNEAMNQAIDLLINNDTDISTLLSPNGDYKKPLPLDEGKI